MTRDRDLKNMLTPAQVQTFIRDGYVCIEEAFPRPLADQGRELLWRDTGCNPNDRATWTRPVIRLGDYAQEPFRQAANTPILLAAFDQLAGPGRWMPRTSLGTFPIRFPSVEDPGDAGWHTDASFAGEDGSWRLNVTSKGRALLMLFLFSDVGSQDAPTRILVGSHLQVPRLLKTAGEDGLSFLELAQKFDIAKDSKLAFVTGNAGTVYLCHPFLIHAAQPHHGSTPRFLAQPPLYPAEPFRIERSDGNYSPVEIAIRIGLGLV